ncbi:aspartate, glycine, lysine and serine-rich protein-like [Bacillus rossius redtenbacheri]|uniref:aspartate, glycine, lysine and serine-rich protein-like n=1 Tax=Bacillus rossius redtenbacheri TaxID=93214 RepID=UPI002FDE0E4A
MRRNAAEVGGCCAAGSAARQRPDLRPLARGGVNPASGYRNTRRPRSGLAHIARRTATPGAYKRRGTRPTRHSSHHLPSQTTTTPAMSPTWVLASCLLASVAGSPELRSESTRSFLAIKRPLDDEGKVEGNMYLARSASSDLASSATGYLFRSDAGQPTSYIHVGVNPQLSAHLEQAPSYLEVPAAEGPHGEGSSHGLYRGVVGARYDEALPVAPLLPQHLEQAPSYLDAASPEEDSHVEGSSYGLYPGGYGKHYGLGGLGGANGIGHGGVYGLGGGQGLTYYGVSGGGGLIGQGGEFQDSGYSKGGGEAHDAAHHAVEGAKGEKGYKVEEAFDKGSAGKHGAEERKGFYGEEGASKKGHHDEAAHYGEQHKGEKGSQGQEYGRRSSHKKGHKTTGFHNVYHKDEFKKEHSFYDDAHASEHDSKHGEYGQKHAAEQGGYEKKGEVDAGYSEQGHGKKGEFAQGAHEDEEKGHSVQESAREHHGHEEDFAEKDGRSSAVGYGHDKGYGYQKGYGLH